MWAQAPYIDTRALERVHITGPQVDIWPQSDTPSIFNYFYYVTVRWPGVNVQDLGSIGELVAAIATVITLGYLALQIRGNTRAMRAEARRSAKLQVSPVNLAISQNKDLASVFRRGMESFDSLQPDEQIQFMLLITDYVSVADSAYSETKSGLYGEADFHTTWDGVKGLLQSPGGRQVWEMQRSHIGSYEFRKFVDAELANGK